MTYRTEDERALLLSFLAWLAAQGIVVEKQLVNEFLKTRAKVWGKNEK